MATKSDPRIDAYITRSAPFAKPILRHLRKLVHKGCPGVDETIKWGFPHFTLNGAMLCGMAGFKAHCTFGFWHKDMKPVVARHTDKAAEAMGNWGRITSLDDLPSDKAILGFVREAVRLNESGVPARQRRASKPRPEAAVPADLAAALRKNKAAAAAFKGFSPSHRREYIEWIVEAKRDETRERRVKTTLEWLSAGKPRNWKYQDC